MEYGVSWQIAPAALEKMVEDLDRQKAQRVMIALYGMKKIDIEGLKKCMKGNKDFSPKNNMKPRITVLI
jgi:hypothetical protein